MKVELCLDLSSRLGSLLLLFELLFLPRIFIRFYNGKNKLETRNHDLPASGGTGYLWRNA